MKRTVLLLALFAVVAVAPFSANAAPKPSIEDVLGDGNAVNDQGTGDGSVGDQNAVGVSTVGDLEAVYFTNDKKNLYVHIDTQTAPPATQGVGYRVRVNPQAGSVYCINFYGLFPGATNAQTAFEAYLVDTCSGTTTQVEVAPGLLGTMITVPRDAHEAFAKGATLTAPQAQTFVWSGSSYPAGVAGPFLDTTKVGTDYKLKK